MKKRFLSIITALALCLSLLPTVALAAAPVTGVPYLDENGDEKTCASATKVTSEDTTWTAGWYVVTGDVTIDSRVTVSGDVHLILMDDYTLTVNGGIQVQDNSTESTPNTNALTIYAQSTDESTMGKLSATTVGGHAGIGGGDSGGSGGKITINGGSVTATSIGGGAAIGGGTAIGSGTGIRSGGSGGTITINGGSVTATCASGGGAGIGGGTGIGSGGSGGTITINGGSVTATCATGGAGIGGGASPGSGGSGGTITINGGTVETTSIGGSSFGYGAPGTFQTTNNGSAVIFANSIGDQSGKTSNAWSGVIFEGNEGKVYGSAVTPIENFTIGSGKTLTIPEDISLTIPEGKTLTNKGTIISNGTLTNNGTIINNGGTITGTFFGIQPKVGVSAEYLDETGTKKTCDTAIVVESGDTTWGTVGKTTWYVVQGAVTISQGVTVSGDVHLILADGCSLTVKNGLTAEGNLTIYAQSTGDAQGSVTATGSVDTWSYGILAAGELTITGGSVTATGGSVTATGGNGETVSYGIIAGNLTISGGSVEAKGSNAMISYGICTHGGDGGLGKMTISGNADVTAIGDNGETGSYGIFTEGDITIESATVNATGGTATATGDNGETRSIGIFSENNITIKGATVNATGGTATGDNGETVSCGIYARNNLRIDGGTVTATGGTATATGDNVDTWSCGIFAGIDLTIDGGSVTATGNDSETLSYGIYADNNLRIDGGSVTATGNDSETLSCGIYARKNLRIGGGSVTATGNDSETLSCGIYARNNLRIDGGHVTAQTLAETATTKAALMLDEAPVLGENFDYYWRTDAAESFTASSDTKQYQYDPDDTYVEISNGLTYTITLAPNYEGGESSTVLTGTKGTLTTEDLPVLTRTGYTFDGWFTEAAGGTEVANETVFERNTTIYAHWTAKSSGGGSGGVSTYAITVESAKNGTVTMTPKTASKGTTVTLTAVPDKGYTLETLTVTDRNGNEIELTAKGDGKFTFKMPGSKVTVKATFMEDNSMLNFFVDVPADAYYYDAVLWAAENGITGGTDATHFSPNAPCTRAQIVTFLWRAAGCPEPESLTSLSDVPADAYYAKAVAWALENGITTGTGDGTTFSPDATCTRAQAMTFIYRSEQAQGGMQGEWMFLNPFNDVNLESYYGEAVMWAVANGVTDGTTATTFSPNANCTRAQIVTFLFRCLGE